MSAKIFKYAKAYGLTTGVKLYLAQKYKKPAVVNFPFLQHDVIFRGQQSKSDLLIFEQIFCSKDYDISMPIDPKVIIDLGANVRFASIYFSNRFPNANIIALEPNKENYEIACKNVKKYDNIKLVHGAVWFKTEEINVVDAGLGEAAFRIEAGKGVNAVAAFTIKDLMETMNTDYIDLLKIDIEGAEKEIFEYGYEDWLPATKIVIVETHDRYRKGTSKAVLGTIAKYDFSLELSGENLIFYNNNFINSY